MSTELLKGSSAARAARHAQVLIVVHGSHGQELAAALGDAGHEPVLVDTPEAGCALLADREFDVVLVESELAEEVAGIADSLDVPVAVLGSAQAAAALGAHSVPTSLPSGAIATVLELLMDQQALHRQIRSLESMLDGVRDGSVMLGKSPVMRRLQSSVSRAADSDLAVLIEGPQGAGKSLAARVIHCKSRRGGKPLFVHEASELDGAGLQSALQEAQGSTLLLEGIERMPESGQKALVTHLKTASARIHGQAPAARVLATTSVDLASLIKSGFREDLHYRLHQFHIVVPSLQQRTEDIQDVVDGLIQRLSAGQGQRPVGLTASARTKLESMSWPGNVAQLEAVVSRAWFGAAGSPIDERHLTSTAPAPVATVGQGANARVATTDAPRSTHSEQDIRKFEEVEREVLQAALFAAKNVRRAAELLGIGRATLYRKVKQMKLKLAEPEADKK